MQLFYEGHACFRIISQGIEILIDPFISGNSLIAKDKRDYQPQLILLTHGHGDHLGDALDIARNCRCTLAAQVDLLAALDTVDIDSIGFNLGGAYHYQHLAITMVQAFHGSTVTGPNGPLYGGLACGYIIDDGEFRIYHAGDTALFGDMEKVISRYQLDCALLPIGDFYTMGPDDAVTAAKWLQAELVIPMHYNTFANIRQDPYLFKEKLEAKTKSKCLVLQPGEGYQLADREQSK